MDEKPIKESIRFSRHIREILSFSPTRKIQIVKCSNDLKYVERENYGNVKSHTKFTGENAFAYNFRKGKLGDF